MSASLAVHAGVLPGRRSGLTRERGGGFERGSADAELLGEGGDDARVELRPRATPQLGECRVRRALRAVDPIRRHRVVRVRDEDDARAERDVLAAQAVRIACTVPPLVVVQNEIGDRIDPEAVEHAEADLWMAFEDEA